MHEVHGPPLIRGDGRRSHGSDHGGLATTGPLPRERQAFVPIEPIHPLAIDGPAFAPEQHLILGAMTS